MKRVALLLLLGVIAACVPPQQRRRRAAPAPCSETVPPIRNIAILVVININYTYNAVDESSARSSHKDDIIEQLNTLGQPDGNTFAEPNGQGTNFTFTYTINNDGQDHFTGGLHFAGWGQGAIQDFGRYQYTYASTDALVRDLTADAYVYIHEGWHDSRPACTGR